MIEIDGKRCELCGTCLGVCSADAMAIEVNELVIDDESCVLCLACVNICPVGALKEDS